MYVYNPPLFNEVNIHVQLPTAASSANVNISHTPTVEAVDVWVGADVLLDALPYDDAAEPLVLVPRGAIPLFLHDPSVPGHKLAFAAKHPPL
jgi:hypothetical protein